MLQQEPFFFLDLLRLYDFVHRLQIVTNIKPQMTRINADAIERIAQIRNNLWAKICENPHYLRFQ